MTRFKTLSRQLSFRIVSSVFWLFLVSWPLYTTPPSALAGTPTIALIFLHLFVSWALLIAFLRWLEEAGKDDEPSGKPP